MFKKFIELISFIANLITVEQFICKTLTIFYKACFKIYNSIFQEKKPWLNKIKINEHLLKYFKIQKNIIIEI
ncbi:hypothetical protein FDB68_07200 [Clostridium botulinum]|nr:hypothetical protein [Clostridium botulinum]NFL92850.1 hypothetical protein [Clostridium botulinum]NFN51584.1 hypothetical protein [Clostridium botulinum]NFO27545.1 hypothetical protein [Clostridium botulinum]NFO59621.1 hypothetical protein [Clostridium botulinum]